MVTPAIPDVNLTQKGYALFWQNGCARRITLPREWGHQQSATLWLPTAEHALDCPPTKAG